MAHPDLDTELTDALDQVDAAEAEVSRRREYLSEARAKLSTERARVGEIQEEIRSKVKTGQSTRPLFDAPSAAEAKATFAEPLSNEPQATKRTRKSPRIGAIAP